MCQIKVFENWITVNFYYPTKNMAVRYEEVNLAWPFHLVPKTRDMYWGILGQFYADKNHIKVSCNILLKNVDWGVYLVMCAHADKNHTKINREYTAKKRCLRTNRYLEQFYADKNYIKISCNISLKNVDWGIYLVMCAHADKNHTKINREYTAKKRCLRTNRYLGQFYADKNHIKISHEYITKIGCLRTPLSHARTRDISRIQR